MAIAADPMADPVPIMTASSADTPADPVPVTMVNSAGITQK